MCVDDFLVIPPKGLQPMSGVVYVYSRMELRVINFKGYSSPAEAFFKPPENLLCHFDVIRRKTWPAIKIT